MAGGDVGPKRRLFEGWPAGRRVGRPTASKAGRSGGWSEDRRLPWLILAVLVMVAGTATAALALRGQGTEQARQQMMVIRIDGLVRQEAMIARQALTEQRLGGDRIAEMVRTRRQTDAVVDRLARPGVDREAYEIRDRVGEYRLAVDEAWQLLAARQVERAYGVEQTRMNPRYLVLGDAIGDADQAFGRRAADAWRRAWTVAAGLGLGTIASIGGMAWWVDGVRRGAARLAGEHDAVRQSEARFRSLVQNSSDMILVLDEDGRLRYASPAFCRVLGWEAAAVLGGDVTELIHPDDMGGVRRAGAEAREAPGLTVGAACRARHRDGTWRHMESLMVNRLDDPGVGGIVANVRDVTEREATAAALRVRDGALAAATNAVLITDPRQADNPIVDANPAFERITGYRLEEVKGRNCRFLQGPESDPVAVGRIRRAVRDGKEVALTLRNYRADGSPFWNEINLAPVRDEEGRITNWVGVLNDVSRRRELEAGLHRLAYRDALTGLPNRERFLSRLREAITDGAGTEGTAIAVLFLDLDGFKLVNDGLGHGAGDELLAAVGRRLGVCVPAGSLLARLGGDEFAVLLAGEAAGGAVGVADCLIEALRAPFVIAGEEAFVTASVGIARRPAHLVAPDELLQDADIALYEAKRLGRATHVLFEPGMRAPLVARLAQETALRRAMERSELRLRYQPVVELASGRVVAFEALVRWEHPEYGELVPGEFLRLAESTGLIVPLGRWTLREACRQVVEWRGQRPETPLVVAVNLSARQLREPGLAEETAAVLREYGVAPEALELEIGEGVGAGQGLPLQRALDELRGVGVRLTLDGFGAGASSLGRLRASGVSGLKIDRSLVSGLGRDGGSEAIVRAVATLARDLSLTLTAEGVETAAQVGRLRELGVVRGQGFYFAGPLWAEAIDEVLRQGATLPFGAAGRGDRPVAADMPTSGEGEGGDGSESWRQRGE